MDNNINIANWIGIFPNDNFFDNAQMDFFNDGSNLLEAEDIKCIQSQMKYVQNINNIRWSKINGINMELPIVKIDSISIHEPFTTHWWDDYSKICGSKKLFRYSFPLFNCSKDVAIITKFLYSAHEGGHENLDIYIYIKNSKGEWEYSHTEGY